MIEISINTFETEMLCNLEVCPILVTKLRPFCQSEQAIRFLDYYAVSLFQTERVDGEQCSSSLAISVSDIPRS